MIVLGRIDTPGDLDIFKVTVEPGGTIEAYLNPGGQDLDIVLFEQRNQSWILYRRQRGQKASG